MVDDKNVADALNDFFDFYEEELTLLRVGASKKTWLGACLALKDHEDILATVRMMRDNSEKSKEEINEMVSALLDSSDSAAVDRSIDLCVRLWLMINVRDSKAQSLRPLDTCLKWSIKESLVVFVESIFEAGPARALSPREARFDVDFTVAWMTNICGLRIHWTRSIHDHLLLDRRRRILSIFAYEHQVEYANSLMLVFALLLDADKADNACSGVQFQKMCLKKQQGL